MSDNRKKKKTATSIIAILAVVLCFGMVVYALTTLSVSVEDNYFQTGTVEINLNDGNPVIEPDEFRFEPGMTVTKDFFVRNESTCDVYYKLYFEDVEDDGGLASVLLVTVKDGDKVLIEGTISELNRTEVAVGDDILTPDEQRNLTISFYYPKTEGNATQGASMSFRFTAEAVQTQNNPDRLFD